MNTIEATINEAGFGRKNIIKKYVEVFKANKLDSDETLLEMATAFDKPTDLLFVTDKRVFYYKMNTTDKRVDKIIGYDQINEVKTEDLGVKKRFVIGTRSQDVLISRLCIGLNDQSVLSIDHVPTEIAETVRDSVRKRVNQKG